MKIGSAIRQVRLEQGATQEQLALEAGTFAGNISKIERGQQLPSLDLLEKIAAALETPVSGLFVLAEGNAPASPEALTSTHSSYANEGILLRRAFNELNHDNRALTVGFVKLLRRLQDGKRP